MSLSLVQKGRLGETAVILELQKSGLFGQGLQVVLCELRSFVFRKDFFFVRLAVL